MAAQERTKQAQTKVEPPKEEDLLMDFDAPSSEKDPPPAFTVSLLPSTASTPSMVDMPPPAFETFENTVSQQQFFPPPPPIDAVIPPPTTEAPPMFQPSAPAFEDLLDSQNNYQQHTSGFEGVQAVPPPMMAPDIDDDFLKALPPEEREALLEEQRKIMEQIEREKAGSTASSAAARALAFDQRSAPAVARAAGAMERPTYRPAASSATKSKSDGRTRSSSSERTVDLGSGEKVPLHGQAKTKQAIKDGTAVLVQCINCQNWMQVTSDATLMFCPVCQVVSPVEPSATGAPDMESVAQMASDQELAERLQQEEYKKAAIDGGGHGARSKEKKKEEVVEEGQSWYDWLVGNPAKKPAAAISPNRASAEVSHDRGPGLVSAQTGEENIRSTGSFGEQESLVRRPGGARVAEQKGMFACVADSITTAASSLTAVSLSEDQEGNVHGVDSSSLLAMPQVSRQRD